MPKPPSLRISILGQPIRFSFRPIRLDSGRCDPPDSRKRRIVVASSLRDKERLSTIIHEALHAACWHLDEDFVSDFSDDVAALLWQLDYRCPGDTK